MGARGGPARPDRRVSMIHTYDVKREAVEQWTHDPCGLCGAEGLEIGSQAFYARVDKNRYEEYAPWMKSTFEFAKFSGKKVLEVGFGMGTDLFQFASASANVSGIDLSPEHLRIARQRFSTAGLGADLRLADAEDLPFEDATFDAVYSFGVIHHTPDAEKAVTEIRRVLKPGGQATIGVYHRYSAHYLFYILLESYLLRLRFLRESYRRTLSRVEYRSHSNACPLVKLYSRRSLRCLLRSFREIRIECRHLDRAHFGKLGWLIPRGVVSRLERRGILGWYLIAKCVR